ncbi:NTP transferase domain-containing protein [Turicibacter bilis]|uniref:sugar phosphate nucleotidyltransferase n=1 Tax=Turicibacter bilis TaxID=2735723 RepID=UPI001BB0626A|nr:sugar phosphate nucleotidyltransferase [Turicibacter bilis]MBS3202824.1 NTP transferase domain-containing protein [Turicibacter bilis]UUF11157.1 NTP transferase domain-containing protein [Turicibacter bilis]
MRAIILAAGMGTRLRPLTLKTPKPLIPVQGEPMAERQIKFLQEKGIKDIIIVTGYLNESFHYLQEKYGVKLVHNDKYNEYNNLYTMYLVKEFLPNAFVLEGDVYLNRNILDETVTESTYFSARKSNFNNEWMLKIGPDGYLDNIVVGSDDEELIMCGVSYWNQEDGEFLKAKLEQAVEEGGFEQLFWDNLVKDSLDELKIRVRELRSDDLFEIDSLDELNELEELLQNK